MNVRVMALIMALGVAQSIGTCAQAREWSPLGRDVMTDLESNGPAAADVNEFVFATPNGDNDQSKANDDEDQKAKEVKPPVSPGIHPTELTNDPTYFYKKAHDLAKNGDYQSALNYINRSLELQPENWTAQYEKGLIYQLAGYDAAAARRYLTIIEHKPEMPEPHLALGVLYRKHKNFDLAEKEYREVLRVTYNSFSAHYNLANLLMDQQKMEPALKEYQACLKLQPNNADVHNNIGVIYQNRNYLEEAAAEFKKASHLEPTNKTFVQNYDAVQVKLGQKGTGTL